MRTQRSNVVLLNGQPYRQCSRCHELRPVTNFYANPASVCKDCHGAASRLNNRIRRAVLRVLTTRYRGEYEALLAEERARHRAATSQEGGGADGR